VSRRIYTAINPITGELYHRSLRSPYNFKDSRSPIQSSSKLIMKSCSLKSVLQPEGTIQFASESHRFNYVDFAAEERSRREAEYQRRR
jgi:hypothetical protein